MLGFGEITQPSEPLMRPWTLSLESKARAHTLRIPASPACQQACQLAGTQPSVQGETRGWAGQEVGDVRSCGSPGTASPPVGRSG